MNELQLFIVQELLKIGFEGITADQLKVTELAVISCIISEKSINMETRL